MHSVLILLHLAGVVVWVGGMFFVHFCLRPVAAQQLPPGPRLQLMTAVLGRFFMVVALSVLAILASGFARMLFVGMAQAPVHWHVMAALGLLMAVIFSVIYLLLYPKLRVRVAAEDWPSAGAVLNRIRPLVATNLLLGVLTIAVATLGAGLAG